MEKALVRLGLIGISSNSSVVVPGIFTVIDWMSKLFKELTGRTGLSFQQRWIWFKESGLSQNTPSRGHRLDL